MSMAEPPATGALALAEEIKRCASAEEALALLAERAEGGDECFGKNLTIGEVARTLFAKLFPTKHCPDGAMWRHERDAAACYARTMATGVQANKGFEGSRQWAEERVEEWTRGDNPCFSETVDRLNNLYRTYWNLVEEAGP